MNSSRQINTPLLLTVISACLGLLIVGLPAPQASRGVGRLDEAPAKFEKLLKSQAFISPLAGFVADLGKLIALEKYELIGSQGRRDEPLKIFYQNDLALVQNNEILIITHLPRAGLTHLTAKRSASF